MDTRILLVSICLALLLIAILVTTILNHCKIVDIQNTIKTDNEKFDIAAGQGTYYANILDPKVKELFHSTVSANPSPYPSSRVWKNRYHPRTNSQHSTVIKREFIVLRVSSYPALQGPLPAQGLYPYQERLIRYCGFPIWSLKVATLLASMRKPSSTRRIRTDDSFWQTSLFLLGWLEEMGKWWILDQPHHVQKIIDGRNLSIHQLFSVLQHQYVLKSSPGLVKAIIARL